MHSFSRDPIRTLLLGGAVAVALTLTGCAAPSIAPAPPAENSEPADTAVGQPEESAAPEAEPSLPADARLASPDFPFPVPAEWEELEPFTADTIGKTASMSAAYRFTGDAESAAAHYRDLLNRAGFSAEDYPLGAVVNDASLIVKGRVDGQAYAGVINFATIHDGTPRATIDLAED